jgi:excisionase family DNA binding protein
VSAPRPFDNMTDTTSVEVPVSTVEAGLPTDFLKPSEVAGRLRASRTALYEWLARGDLPCYRLGRNIRIREADVVEFLRRRRIAPVPIRSYGRLP